MQSMSSCIDHAYFPSDSNNLKPTCISPDYVTCALLKVYLSNFVLNINTNYFYRNQLIDWRLMEKYRCNSCRI